MTTTLSNALQTVELLKELVEDLSVFKHTGANGTATESSERVYNTHMFEMKEVGVTDGGYGERYLFEIREGWAGTAVFSALVTNGNIELNGEPFAAISDAVVAAANAMAIEK